MKLKNLFIEACKCLGDIITSQYFRISATLLMVIVFVVAIVDVTVMTTSDAPVEAETTTAEIEQTETQQDYYYESLGEYELTAYCPCPACCGGYADGITSTGTEATAGRTIAVDPSKIPYGTVICINGIDYVAEDCGVAIKDKRLDIYFDTHDEALNFGRQTAEVFIKRSVENANQAQNDIA